MIPVVGVKLDIGVWMTSFINTTQRPNVSRLHRAERLWLRFHKAAILPPAVSRLH